MLRLFTARQLEIAVAGEPEFDIGFWKEHTEYKGYRPDDDTVVFFWKVRQSRMLLLSEPLMLGSAQLRSVLGPNRGFLVECFHRKGGNSAVRTPSEQLLAVVSAGLRRISYCGSVRRD